MAETGRELPARSDFARAIRASISSSGDDMPDTRQIESAISASVSSAAKSPTGFSSRLSQALSLDEAVFDPAVPEMGMSRVCAIRIFRRGALCYNSLCTEGDGLCLLSL